MLREKELSSLLFRMMESSVGTPGMAEIDREMTPILEELLTLGPGNNEHPAVKQLFNWLVDPQQSGVNFCYVIGPLYEHVSEMMDLFKTHYVYKSNPYFCKYLCKVGVEALAVKCPVLEGPWEQAAWFLIKDIDNYNRDEYGVATNLLTAWVIHAIGDPDLCPNPHLRIKLMCLLYLMVDLKDHHLAQTLESVFSACSSLDLDCLMEGLDCLMKGGLFNENGFHTIIQTLYLLVDYDNKDAIMEFDRELANKLLNVKTSRLSAIVHDVAYHCAVNSKRYNQPMALHGLTALLNTIAECAQQVRCQLNNINIRLSRLCSFIEGFTDLMCLLIIHFEGSCRTPQLGALTASCIMEVRELVNSVRDLDPIMFIKKFRQRIRSIMFLYGKFYTYNMKVTMEFLHNYNDDIEDDNGEDDSDEDDNDDGDRSDDDFD